MHKTKFNCIKNVKRYPRLPPKSVILSDAHFFRNSQRDGETVHVAKIRLSGVQKRQVEPGVGRGVRRVQKRVLFREPRPAENGGNDVLLLRREPVQQRQANDQFFESHRHDRGDNHLQHHEVFENAHATSVKKKLKNSFFFLFKKRL